MAATWPDGPLDIGRPHTGEAPASYGTGSAPPYLILPTPRHSPDTSAATQILCWVPRSTGSVGFHFGRADPILAPARKLLSRRTDFARRSTILEREFNRNGTSYWHQSGRAAGGIALDPLGTPHPKPLLEASSSPAARSMSATSTETLRASACNRHPSCAVSRNPYRPTGPQTAGWRGMFLILGIVLVASWGALASPAFAEGDAAKGEKFAKRCVVCHTFEEGKNKVGPSLHGVYGRTAGRIEDFKYSPSYPAAGDRGLVWTEETLIDYLKDPKKFLRAYLGDKRAQSRMTMRFPKESDRRNVIAFLKSRTTE